MNLSELLVVLVVVLLVFTPKKLPELVQTLGRLFRIAKFYTQATKDEIHAFMQPIIQQAKLEENEIRAKEAEEKYKISQ